MDADEHAALGDGAGLGNLRHGQDAGGGFGVLGEGEGAHRWHVVSRHTGFRFFRFFCDAKQLIKP